MFVAIHKREGGFALQWIRYCEENNIPYKVINCYANNIIEELKDVTHLLWHYHRWEVKNGHIASQLLGVFETMGIKVFPNFTTRLSFDEKILQKYLLESIEAPFPETNVFFNQNEAYNWIDEKSNFEKVFKLSKGAGSKNVSLVNKEKAISLVKYMFTKGENSFFTPYPKLDFSRKGMYGLKRYLLNRKPFTKLKNMLVGKEFGYVYFQEFLPNNDHDIRIITFKDKAVGAKRLVADNSFKASGSGKFFYEKEDIPTECIRKAFEVSEKLNFQFMAYDFVKHPKKGYVVVEICSGVSPRFYDSLPGFWDKNLVYTSNSTTNFKLENIIIEDLLKE